MLKRFVALTCTAMVCAAMFLSTGCGEKKPATPPAPAPDSTPSPDPGIMPPVTPDDTK